MPNTSVMHPGQQDCPSYVAEHNLLTAFHDPHRVTVQEHLESQMAEEEIIVDVREDVDLFAEQILLLHPCFRLYKTWQRSVYCPWIERPRSWPPGTVGMDDECVTIL